MDSIDAALVQLDDGHSAIEGHRCSRIVYNIINLTFILEVFHERVRTIFRPYQIRLLNLFRQIHNHGTV